MARSLGKSLDRDALQKYFDLVVSRAGETYEFLNPLFRGRETVLNQLHANVLRAKAGALANRTAIVHGAPGAGKSELMLHFMHQIVELHEEQIVAVRGSTSALRNAPLFVSQLLQSLPRTDRISNAVSGLKHEVHEMLSISAFEFSSTRSSDPARSLDDHISWLDGYLPELPAVIRERTFVFCVDEFHTLADPENSLCLPLHSAELGIRAVPVYFGLSDAPMVLAQASVSRVEDSNSIALGALDSESAFSLVRDFCDCMKIEYASNLDRDRIVRDVVARCDSWPHHLTAWMRTACETLPNCDYLITPEAHMEIDRRCDIHRKEYYAARLAGCRYLRGRDRREKFGSLLHNRSSVTELEIEETLLPTFKRSTSTFLIDEFMDDAIHRGLLVERQDGNFEVPIPSLIQFLRDPDTI